jgi:hypothetical protein
MVAYYRFNEIEYYALNAWGTKRCNAPATGDTMNTLEIAAFPEINLDTIEIAMRRARSERAEHLRRLLAATPALFKRLAARLRPNRQPLPQAGVWA